MYCPPQLVFNNVHIPVLLFSSYPVKEKRNTYVSIVNAVTAWTLIASLFIISVVSAAETSIYSTAVCWWRRRLSNP